MTFSLFAKEIHYIWEGNIYENSKKDLRRWEGSKKEIHSAFKSAGFQIQWVQSGLSQGLFRKSVGAIAPIAPL